MPQHRGQTLSAEELAKQEAEGVFGDVAGVGPGRNWAHVNSVDYDPTDDSIIISSRHQSAIIKIGRDKQVKWILTTPTDRSDKYKGKILTSVGKDGKPPQMRKQRLRKRLRLDANATYGPDRRLEDNQGRALPHGLA